MRNKEACLYVQLLVIVFYRSNRFASCIGHPEITSMSRGKNSTRFINLNTIFFWFRRVTINIHNSSHWRNLNFFFVYIISETHMYSKAIAEFSVAVQSTFSDYRPRINFFFFYMTIPWYHRILLNFPLNYSYGIHSFLFPVPLTIK